MRAKWIEPALACSIAKDAAVTVLAVLLGHGVRTIYRRIKPVMDEFEIAEPERPAKT